MEKGRRYNGPTEQRGHLSQRPAPSSDHTLFDMRCYLFLTRWREASRWFCSPSIEVLPQESSRMGVVTVVGNFQWSTACNDVAALFATSRSQVDYIVRIFYDVEVVLDGDDRVAHLHQTMKYVNKFLHVGKVEPRGRLVQNIERFPMGLLAELVGKLDSLSFTSGQRVACLS